MVLSVSNTKNLINKNITSSCFFRTKVNPPYRKALLQITEKCDLKCVHCFVSSEEEGNSLSIKDIKSTIIPRLIDSKVTKITLTGGEPLLHPHLNEVIQLLVNVDIEVGVCTNGYSLTSEIIENISRIGNTHFNVSLDGFSSKSHNSFRRKEDAFEKTIQNINILSDYDLLQGILVTPNIFASASEYEDIFKFAIEKKAEYVLMNPLSSFGRGVESKQKYGASIEMMTQIRKITEKYRSKIQPVYIRFPNNALPLSKCESVGNIIYIFTNGRVAICPYLAFATDDPTNVYGRDKFIAGNILKDDNIAELLDSFDYSIFEDMGKNVKCVDCEIALKCGKGCPAAIVGQGLRIGEVDTEICPFSLE